MSKYANEDFNEKLLSSSFLAEKNIRVLKHDELFGIFDRYGDISKRQEGEQGLYNAGTRYLSRCELYLCGKKPLLLSSFITNDNSVLLIDYTNPSFETEQVPSGAIHILRTIFLWGMKRYDHFTLSNYLDVNVHVDLRFAIEADFSDIFEVRGHSRVERGEYKSTVSEGNLNLHYTGLDGIARQTLVRSSPQPSDVGPGHLQLAIDVPGKGNAQCELTFMLSEKGHDLTRSLSRETDHVPFAAAYVKAREDMLRRRDGDASITTSNESFNDFLNRSLSDIHLLTTDTSSGPYPYAGVPWFSAPFGRDGIITALELLWVNPQLARSVLHFLAETQGQTVDEARDCEPGKIIHEVRQGEMANLAEIPFKRYYGSVDSTPLFILLAGAFYKRTGDRAFIQDIWPNVKAALDWTETYGINDDGFIDYCRQTEKGLKHQGWKDSDNSIFHADGELAEAPVALSEVQGYLYFALKRAAFLADVMGDDKLAEQLSERRSILRKRFHEVFWLDGPGYFALAVDRNKMPCRVKSSNMGHCLFSGIASQEQAARVADVLMSPEMFSGWGVRTIGENELLYNPMSYHNGTIWPHDSAIVGAGLARYGYKEHCLRILTGLFDAANRVDFHRLPELFCGFTRTPDHSPTIYPMSCAPQAWAAGSVFMLLAAALGIKVKATTRELFLFQPRLPSYIDALTIRNLRVGQDASVDLEIVNHGTDAGVNILSRQGAVKVLVEK